MLVHIKKLFEKDIRGKFAYPAFNTQNLETTLGIVAASEATGVPVIIETSEGTIKYAGLDTIYEIMATIATRSPAIVALHMDHGKDVEQLKAGINLGYSSVMIDHSFKEFKENAADTKAMVDFAHKHGAWVQGEIGKIRGSEDWVSVSDSEALLTNVDDAKAFLKATGVDTLACSFGTVHGIAKIRGKAKPHVSIKRISEIANAVDVPLVLHGASGLPESVITDSIAAGISIVNIDTELRVAYSDALRASMGDRSDEVDPRKLMEPVIEAIRDACIIKIHQLNTKNIL